MADLIRMGDDGTLQVPDEPIIPFIEGDGTGVDIWPAAKLVLDAAAAKHGHTVAWKEVLAGQKAFDETGSWLPDWPCARSSISTCACARCAGSPASPRPYCTPSWSTW
jgi:isocitrate dehydrogenase